MTTLKQLIHFNYLGKLHFEILKHNPRAVCNKDCACSRLHRAMGDYVLENQIEGTFEAPVSAPEWLRRELSQLAANLLCWSFGRGAFLIDREE